MKAVRRAFEVARHVPWLALLVATVLACAGEGPLAVQRGAPPTGRVIHVSPGGTPSGTGEADLPLDLATALSRQGPAVPGDTILLHGGTYRGRFDSHLLGRPDAPIIVRQAPGERATIDSNDNTRDPPDGALNLRPDGGYAWYWGFEVMNSHPLRSSADADAFPTDLYRANGVNVYASNVRLINLVIHDVDNGVFVGDRETAVDIEGLIAYYNGHHAPTSSWGHGLYVQNASRTRARVLRDNITFANVSHGIHAYGGVGRGLNAIRLEGNISFHNGALSRLRLTRNLLLGGLSQASDAVVTNNYTYAPRPEGENNIGYTTGAPGAVVTDNYFIGGRPTLALTGAPSQFSRNVFYGTTSPASLATQYPGNTVHATRPGDRWVFVRGTANETGRGYIVVYNWTLQPDVSVDLAPIGLRPGARFSIRDVQDYFGAPVVSGVYDGKSVSLPLATRRVATPVGDVPSPPHTLPEFGVFVVTPSQARPRP